MLGTAQPVSVTIGLYGTEKDNNFIKTTQLTIEPNSTKVARIPVSTLMWMSDSWKLDLSRSYQFTVKLLHTEAVEVLNHFKICLSYWCDTIWINYCYLVPTFINECYAIAYFSFFRSRNWSQMNTISPFRAMITSNLKILRVFGLWISFRVSSSKLTKQCTNLGIKCNSEF